MRSVNLVLAAMFLTAGVLVDVFGGFGWSTSTYLFGVATGFGGGAVTTTLVKKNGTP